MESVKLIFNGVLTDLKCHLLFAIFHGADAKEDVFLCRIRYAGNGNGLSRLDFPESPQTEVTQGAGGSLFPDKTSLVIVSAQAWRFFFQREFSINRGAPLKIVFYGFAAARHGYAPGSEK